VESIVRYTATTHSSLDICDPTLARLFIMYLSLLYSVLTLANLGYGVMLLRRDLTSYPLARCSDGSAAAYYHEKDVRLAGDKVLIYLPDGGYCSSVPDCIRRCQDNPSLCSSPAAPVVDKQGGIWSGSFSQYFKIFIHYCSSDSFAGTQPSSLATGNLTFHGRHILAATLQDLVARLGIDRAGSVVLAGSGSGARGVGYNCDFVSSALAGRVRCLADSPDFVPWWVKTEEQQCQGRDREKIEREISLWGGVGDSSCIEDNKGSPSLSYRCGVLSQYWQDISTPLLIVASQYDPVYYESSPCTPGVNTGQYGLYRAAWEKGVLGLAESVQARRTNLTSLFIPSCAGHTFLSEVFMVGVQVGEDSLTLKEVITKWLNNENPQAIDILGEENTKCPVPAPLKAPCGNLLGCGSQGIPSRKHLYHARNFNRRLLPPTSLFPTTYTRNCNLDPWYISCSRGLITSPSTNSYAHNHKDAVDPVHTVAHAGAGRRRRLWQKLYYLQYLKKLFQKYRLAYAREYHAEPAVVREKVVPTILRPSRPRIFVAQRRVPSVVTVERPPVAKVPHTVPALDYDYDYDYDYSPADYDHALHDYADYYDYSPNNCNADCALSRIVKALKIRKKEKNTSVETKVRNAGSQDQDEILFEKFKEFLKETDLEYEDFGQLNSEVKTLDKELLRLQERKDILT